MIIGTQLLLDNRSLFAGSFQLLHTFYDAYCMKSWLGSKLGISQRIYNVSPHSPSSNPQVYTICTNTWMHTLQRYAEHSGSCCHSLPLASISSQCAFYFGTYLSLPVNVTWNACFCKTHKQAHDGTMVYLYVFLLHSTVHGYPIYDAKYQALR